MRTLVAMLLAAAVFSPGVARADDDGESHVLRSVRLRGKSPVLSRLRKSADGRFIPFTTMKQSETEPVHGHVGGLFSFSGTHLAFTSGMEQSPIGVHSSFTDYNRSPFLELGLRQSLIKNERHNLSFFGTWGRNWGDMMDSRVGYFEMNHTITQNPFRFSLHLNHRQADGGISPYDEDEWFFFDRGSYRIQADFEMEF